MRWMVVAALMNRQPPGQDEGPMDKETSKIVVESEIMQLQFYYFINIFIYKHVKER